MTERSRTVMRAMLALGGEWMLAENAAQLAGVPTRSAAMTLRWAMSQGWAETQGRPGMASFWRLTRAGRKVAADARV